MLHIAPAQKAAHIDPLVAQAHQQTGIKIAANFAFGGAYCSCRSAYQQGGRRFAP
jgi:hypothetical protein